MKKNPSFSININQIPPEGREFKFSVDSSWVDDNLGDCDICIFSEEGSLNVFVTPVGSDYYIKGNVVLTIKTTCVRCLRAAVISLNVPLSFVMVKEGSSHLLTKQNLSEPGIRRFSNNELIFDEEVRESILLEMPMNPTCPQGCSIDDLYRD